MTSALQALEVRLLQDAVDLQVGHQVFLAGQFCGVGGAEGTVGARGAAAARTAASRMLWTADAAAALTIG